LGDIASVRLLGKSKANLNWGQIKFKQGREISETARFLRVPADIDMDELHQFLTNKATWGLDSHPSLLISITGQAGNVNLRPNHLKRLSTGLMGAALSTDAWIVTGGMDAGIMNTIGKMQSMHQVGTPCIGICTWGCVKNHIQLQTAPGEQARDEAYEYDNTGDNIVSNPGGAFLDPNHTHYLLVDSGKSLDTDGGGAWGGEIGLRVKLEEYVTHCRFQEQAGGWMFYSDSGWSPYTDNQSDQLTRAYEAKCREYTLKQTSGSGQPSATQYVVNFDTMQQSNTDTGYSRQVKAPSKLKSKVQAQVQARRGKIGESKDEANPASSKDPASTGPASPARRGSIKINSTELLMEEQQVPSMLFVYGGGPGTIKNVEGSVDNHIPVVVVENSGRAADIIYAAVHKSDAEYQEKLAEEWKNEADRAIFDKKIKKVLKEGQLYFYDLADTNTELVQLIIRSLVENSQLSANVKLTMLTRWTSANTVGADSAVQQLLMEKPIEVSKGEPFLDEELLVYAVFHNRGPLFRHLYEHGYKVDLWDVLLHYEFKKPLAKKFSGRDGTRRTSQSPLVGMGRRLSHWAFTNKAPDKANARSLLSPVLLSPLVPSISEDHIVTDVEGIAPRLKQVPPHPPPPPKKVLSQSPVLAALQSPSSSQ
jgi:hypothetical protein